MSVNSEQKIVSLVDLFGGEVSFQYNPHYKTIDMFVSANNYGMQRSVRLELATTQLEELANDILQLSQLLSENGETKT